MTSGSAFISANGWRSPGRQWRSSSRSVVSSDTTAVCPTAHVLTGELTSMAYSLCGDADGDAADFVREFTRERKGPAWRASDRQPPTSYHRLRASLSVRLRPRLSSRALRLVRCGAALR